MRVDDSRITATYMLASRISEHKQGVGSAFTAKYEITRLVWFEHFMLVAEARDREYAMKKWRRDWKTNLIERDNPNWDDLFPVLTGAELIKR
jgi:putative endonuclease